MKSKKYITDNELVLTHPNISDVLIFDIETDSLDTDNAVCKFFGAYSYKYQKYYILHEHEKERIQYLIDNHKVLVGFNNKDFDNVILENSFNKFKLDYKICFDCLKVLYDHKWKRPNRELIIEIDGKSLGELLPNRKLKTIAEVLNFPTLKGDIDYKIFQKNNWSESELNEIYEYLLHDLDVTRRLFEFYVTYFDNFREYVNDDNIRKFDYIRSSIGSFAYAAICNLTNIPYEYEDDYNKKKIKPENEGGFVLEPQVEYAEGTIIYKDFTSLYPFIFFQCNLFTHGDVEDWHGDGFFQVKGYYKTDKLGKIETLLRDMYYKRFEYKKNKDSREKAIKILMNTIYGLSGSPIFKNLFDIYTPGDCTSIGRTCIRHAKLIFESKGISVLYMDTDSCFIKLPYGMTIEETDKISDDIVKELQSHMPFPDIGFKLKNDAIFKKIWFHKKKHYIGITSDNKLVIKGHSIIKHDSSQLSQVIFKKLKPMIIERCDIKFDKDMIKDMIDEEIRKDISLVGQVYNVRSPGDYKSLTGLHAQIATEFGEGLHLLIPNKSLGPIGKSKKYCTVDDVDKLTVDDLILDKVWQELSVFVKDYMDDKELKKVMIQYEKQKDKELQAYLNSDLFDSEAVGYDISKEEFFENEKWFDIHE